MSEILNKIDLRKKQVIDLKKKAGMAETDQARVFLVMDHSGSMSDLYRNGTVQSVVERILPIGLAFDNDGSVETIAFTEEIKVLPAVTLSNVIGYVPSKLQGSLSWGGTNYAPALNYIYDNAVGNGGAAAAVKSFFGGLFGSKKEEKTPVSKKLDYPIFVIFITDGNNFDKSDTEAIIRKASAAGMFVQFIGIGTEAFLFLDKLDNLSGRVLDNVNFFKVRDINQLSDQQLYEGIMKEYPGWVLQARGAGYIS